MCEEEPSGGRPDAFAKPRLQERVQRHTVEQLGVFAPMVQILDVLEPQIVRRCDPEQVIAVPKISCPSRPLRAALAATQMAEQLVEVPTDMLVVVQQTVDIPVPGAHGSFGYGGLQGFLPEQSSSPSSVEWIIDIPVQGGGAARRGSLHGFHPGQSSLQPSVEQNVENPVRCEGLQNFLPDQGSTASSAVLPEVPF